MTFLVLNVNCFANSSLTQVAELETLSWGFARLNFWWHHFIKTTLKMS